MVPMSQKQEEDLWKEDDTMNFQAKKMRYPAVIKKSIKIDRKVGCVELMR